MNYFLLREQIADKYIDHLKTQKEWGLSEMAIGEWNQLKDYLITEGLWDRISDQLKWKFFGQFLDALDSKSFTIWWVEYASVFDYLKPMKEKLEAAQTDVALQSLLSDVENMTVGAGEPWSVDLTVPVAATVWGLAITATLASHPELFGDRRKSCIRKY